jgi:outer membrane receptor protein involved in Fe transport
VRSIQIRDSWSAFGRYSEGFRAPPFDDVNLGFTNYLGGYKTISAPDLTSETSEGFEVGLRFLSEYAEISVAAFSTDYDDFIASAGERTLPHSVPRVRMYRSRGWVFGIPIRKHIQGVDRRRRD